MKEVATSRGVVHFSMFEVDLRNGELRKHGIRIRLQDKPFHILQILLENVGELVTREELRRQIWPADTFVDFEKGINNAIKRLRDGLGDSAEHPRFIETLSKRGYRFIAPVSMNGAPAASAVDELIPKGRMGQDSATVAMPTGEAGNLLHARAGAFKRKGKYFLATLGVLMVTAGMLGWEWHSRHSVASIRSLAVLPMENLSNDPGQEYFADGMTDALTTDLSQVSALRVISRTSAMRYKKSDKSLPQIGRELGVDAVVEGTVQRSGDRVRITAQLIEGKTDKHLWANSYERNLQDVLSLQGDIAKTIAKEISVKLTPQERARMARAQPINLRAMEDYLQGEYHYKRARELVSHREARKERQPELDTALNFFQLSANEDPGYAHAYLGMGEIWGVPAGFPYPPLSTEKPAREALAKALAIEPDMAEAYVALAKINYRAWNWRETERDAKRAIELNPNLAAAHDVYSAYLLATGQMEAAMKEAEQVQQLDPGQDRVAWVFYCQRRFDRFIELKKNDIARHAYGTMAHYDLGYGYERAGMYKEAVEEWEEAMTGFGYGELAEDLRRGEATGGFKGAMREWVSGWEGLVRKGEPVYPELPAYIYGLLGERDRAFAWMEKAMEVHSSGPPAFKTDPTVDALRSDPRFEILLRRVGAP